MKKNMLLIIFATLILLLGFIFIALRLIIIQTLTLPSIGLILSYCVLVIFVMILLYRQFTTLKRAINKHIELERQLKITNKKLLTHGQESDLLNEMSDSLQACSTFDEAHELINRFCHQLLPKSTGALYLLLSSNQLKVVTKWGNTTFDSANFVINDCLALHSRQLFVCTNPAIEAVCKHVAIKAIKYPYLCAPLIAQGQIIGLIYFEMHDNADKELLLDDGVLLLINTLAQHIAFAFTNIKLRATLLQQSIVDPLTGLFNRRYLEESLKREISTSKRKDQPLAILMLDFDNFKDFNDNYGHETGDFILQEFSRLLQRSVRVSDIVCRFGGEEFLLVLPDITLASAVQRAEQLRQETHAMVLMLEDKLIKNFSISAGVAIYPDHGASPEKLIEAADQALYKAKRAGRNRVVVAGHD